MRLLPFCSMVIVVGLAACSDDGVPADSTGTDSAASTGTMTTGTPSTSSPTSSSGTTDEASTSSGDNTTGGSDSTFGPEGSGTTIEEPTGTASTTEPTSTGESSSSSGSGSDSGTDSGSGTESGSGSGSGTESGESTGGPGPGEVGAECKGDMQCDSGVCWDFSDYDMFCFGAVCSVPCMGDDECVAAFTEAGAPFPENVLCGDDNRCVPLESGFGAWACAAEK